MGAPNPAAMPIATSPMPSACGRSLGLTEVDREVLPPTMRKFQPRPSNTSSAISAIPLCSSMTTRPTPKEPRRTNPTAGTASGPIRSASQPEIGEGTNMPATCIEIALGAKAVDRRVVSRLRLG
jgi:hypothetical protein